MGLQILINGEKVYETPGDSDLPTELVVGDQYGEHAKVGIANDVKVLNLTLTVRDPIDNNNALDIREKDARLSAGEAIEARGAELVEEGRAQIQEFDRARLMTSGDFPRDENGNPIRSDGNGGVEVLMDVAAEREKDAGSQTQEESSNEDVTSVETEVTPNELGTPQLSLPNN